MSTPALKRRSNTTAILASACVALLAVGFIWAWAYLSPNNQANSAANAKSYGTPVSNNDQDSDRSINDLTAQSGQPVGKSGKPRQKLILTDRVVITSSNRDSDGGNKPEVSQTPELENRSIESNEAESTLTWSSQTAIAFINERIRSGWKRYDVEPSQAADDGEWIRRTYLDIVGHIPPVDEVVPYLTDKDPNKRSDLIDRLLDDSDYMRNWTTIWSNLLIGRLDDREVNRPALQKYLRESFARNRPWSQMVYDFVSAEGNCEENGATNFLLAHLNNQAVPATAITARLFLGVQIHCTQCHDHPLHSDWKQNQFWELHSFFQQTAKVTDRKRNTRAGGNGFSNVALVSKDVGGPVFYETRRGLMRVAYPKFSGTAVDPKPNVNRRRELATMMTSGQKPLIAQAIVNRMWGHFFGFGFTRSVDDMGPHSRETHPELLDRLSREFVKSGYDLKQLIRWICNSEAYQLSSRFRPQNQEDDPAAGTDPLFSRVYLKSMTAEQLFDSLLIATRTHHAWGSNWTEVERKRQQWLQQFVIALQTDENDEATTFDGTIPQALMMMNSELMQQALNSSRGTYLSEVVREGRTDVEKIQRICLATVSRYPSSRELAAFKKLLRQNLVPRPQRSDLELSKAQGLQDIFWAYLNSNEFILIY